MSLFDNIGDRLKKSVRQRTHRIWKEGVEDYVKRELAKVLVDAGVVANDDVTQFRADDLLSRVSPEDVLFAIADRINEQRSRQT